ncbi:protein FAR1-RELATED SEQUENCE 4-like [Eutrema salsugineum]|uniref:protein FAR1-RELATED SEQUENCE 4-like n=1 Tax=Eutrema salsugineum TaxID=72664 RepID=UPI000CED1C4F|nr:protein FAR1-RELATED SEQUENCE 4-like [Eutrema salsugineum]
MVDKAAHKGCFGVKTEKSDQGRVILKCQQADRGCPWYLHAARIKESTYFSVRVYRSVHTCSRVVASTSRKRRKGTPQVVASVLRDAYPGQIDTPAPKSIINVVQVEAGINVSYSTALRGKKLAVSEVRGSPVESFRKLCSYLYVLERVNPGTVTCVKVDAENKFKYLFIALGACIEGFRAMRKVIVMDATFLKNIYGGMLVFATAQDPNHHHYPIAMGVIDREKDGSWNWFLETLKTVIPDDEELVFMSDRHKSILKAVHEVYPKSQHGHCVWHLSQNVRGKAAVGFKDICAARFRDCAHMYTEYDFISAYTDFGRRFPKAAEYLAAVPVEKWARCYFKGDKYNLDTSNACESMNSVFKRARKYSLLPLIDAYVEKLSEWFNKHRKDTVSATSLGKQLVPYVENELHTRCAVATHLLVTELNGSELEYSVTGVDGKRYQVDLLRRNCSCRCFDIDKIPCVHAIAATMALMRQERRSVDIELSDLCSEYCLTKAWSLAYSRTIYLVPHESSWDVPENIRQSIVHPPDYIKKRGRKQDKRFPSTGEPRRKRANNRSNPGINLGR